jgi:folate-binding protein YgfZ
MSDKDISKNLLTINFMCSLIDFSGEKVIEYLNNLLISDLNQLNNQKFNYSAICNPKGRILSSLWIKIINIEHVQLICPINMSDELIQFFNLRKFRQKINILKLDNNIIIDKKHNEIKLSQNETDDKYYYPFLFEQNLPWIDKCNSEKFIPQHVNLDQHENIMSFTKGCYPGQEIIARMKFLGKIKKRMNLIKHTDYEKILLNTKKEQIVSPVVQIPDNNMYAVQVIQPIK